MFFETWKSSTIWLQLGLHRVLRRSWLWQSPSRPTLNNEIWLNDVLFNSVNKWIFKNIFYIVKEPILTTMHFKNWIKFQEMQNHYSDCILFYIVELHWELIGTSISQKYWHFLIFAFFQMSNRNISTILGLKFHYYFSFI